VRALNSTHLVRVFLACLGLSALKILQQLLHLYSSAIGTIPPPSDTSLDSHEGFYVG
jgi:hypothetical protein